MLDYQKDFIQYALDCGVLKFGEFQLKSGRMSPYFFNTGLFDTGAKLGKLGEFYARALLESKLNIDMLFGPAYKGIPLVSATSIAYARITGRDMPFAFNRKEAKGHGEGGVIVGTPLSGKVLILDDVITAGTSVRESVVIINGEGAYPAGVLIALDRQEKCPDGQSATQEVRKTYDMPVQSIVSLEQIIKYLETVQDLGHPVDAIIEYRKQYGI